ncbi:hypothetical protein T10_1537 [Trichinella papuae]|uniref:Uncharacterized protein n=1 Tax=Trichinella papuae TaxID=268474 RepID=A0A0V1MX16_9BILA|nr:hypothetical protein T10_1537 [Trichinella papuae]
MTSAYFSLRFIYLTNLLSCRENLIVALRQIREWLEKRDWPQEPPAGSHMFRSLWSQRHRLTLRDGILCRAWEAPDREEEKVLQVVPRRNISEVL